MGTWKAFWTFCVAWWVLTPCTFRSHFPPPKQMVLWGLDRCQFCAIHLFEPFCCDEERRRVTCRLRCVLRTVRAFKGPDDHSSVKTEVGPKTLGSERTRTLAMKFSAKTANSFPEMVCCINHCYFDWLKVTRTLPEITQNAHGRCCVMVLAFILLVPEIEQRPKPPCKGFIMVCWAKTFLMVSCFFNLVVHVFLFRWSPNVRKWMHPGPSLLALHAWITTPGTMCVRPCRTGCPRARTTTQKASAKVHPESPSKGYYTIDPLSLGGPVFVFPIIPDLLLN